MLINEAGTQLSRTVVDVNLPHSIVYHLHEAHMIFEHYFREHDDHVHYKVVASSEGNALFRFLSNLIKGKVRKTMEQIVEDFKTYVESK